MMPRFAILTVAAATALIAAAPLAAQSNFGSAVSLSGNELFVGQPENFYGPGVVYAYGRDGAGWAERARVIAPDSGRSVRFGASVAASGDYLVVGAPAGDDQLSRVYVFRRADDGNGWLEVQSFEEEPRPRRTSAGWAVAMANQHVFYGSPGMAGGGRVAVRALSSGGGGPDADLTGSELDDSAGFGAALALEGDLLLVGAPAEAEGAGAAVVFRRNGSGQWVEEATLRGDAVLGEQQARLGSSVSLRHGSAYVAAPFANGGAGTVLRFVGTEDGWVLAEQLHPFDGRGGRFGSAMAASSTGLWVGAPGANGGDGQVYQFAPDAFGGWSSSHALLPDSANTAQWPFGFGTAVAAGDDAVAVGMPRRDFGEGRASVFAMADGAWTETSTLTGQIFTAVPGEMQGLECEDGKIEVFDCSNMELVSFLPVGQLGGARGVWVNDVWGWTDPQTDKNYALVSRRDGAAFVDLSNPSAPRLVGSLPRHEGSRPSVWRDIKVYDDHAFIVSDGAGAHGMQVFDLTRLRDVSGDPVTFTEDAHYDRIHSAHNVVANTETGFMYVVGANGGGETCGGGLHMVDVRTPTSPTFAGCYTDATGANAQGYTHDAQCVVYHGPDDRYTGREICVGSNGVEINIADVTDKSNPTPIGRSGYPNVAYAHQGWFDEEQRYFYMGDESDELQGNIDGTRTLVWDLAELDDPVLVHEYIGPVMATDHNMFINGNRIYQSNYGSGLRVIDITNRENPQEVAFFDSAPLGNNEAGMSSAQSGAWSNYPFFEDGMVVFTSVREGLFIMRVKPTPLVP